MPTLFPLPVLQIPHYPVTYVLRLFISLFMIKRGLAAYYRPKCQDYPEDKQLYDYDPRGYVNAEKEARTAHLLIWSEKSVNLPCQYRKENPYH